ncbi:MAG: hypothetical protein WKG52_14505 [Variovorax sp.]
MVQSDPAPRRAADAHADADAWQPASFAVWGRQWRNDGDVLPRSILLQHPGDPFKFPLEDARNEKALQAGAFAYLVRLGEIDPRLDLPGGWLDALEPGKQSPAFGWMPEQGPISAGSKDFTEPFGSFRVRRNAVDSHVVLFATERFAEEHFRGSGYGLRIVVRLHALAAGKFEGHIHGVSVSRPAAGQAALDIRSAAWTDAASDLLDTMKKLETLGRIAALADLQLDTVRIRGLSVESDAAGKAHIEWRGVGMLAGSGPGVPGTPCAYTVRLHSDGGGALLHRTVLVADAAGRANVFLRDPASQGPVVTWRGRRPSRRDQALDPFRPTEEITTSIQKPLADGTRVKVLPCPRFVPSDKANQAGARPVSLPGSGPEMRSADAAAVQGFRHARELFRRLEAYGLPPNSYFRVVKPALHVAYRSGISPGPGKDGRTVNARVTPENWPASFIATPQEGFGRPALQLHLACADLSRRTRKPWDAKDGRSRAQPFGIGADARWMWHEFGHVLLMATTGELELRFAHSPGDALAAILMDPDSTLRSDPLWRFATFPWVFLPRRHDRCPLHGWSWDGAIHAELARVPDAEQPRRKGYRSEQILSSSLFRLYRCLGGDAQDESERRRASHYTAYLLMHALQLLGDARVVPARTPEDLVFALILADICTGAWSAIFPAQSGPYLRTGGCAHKAIRWAFEAQGLYVLPGQDGNAPGAPPPVDVFIESGRPEVEATPQADIPFGPGNYQPISLHWQADSGNAVPQWQAHEDAVRVHADGSIGVEVRNRGQHTAGDVEVRVWLAEWPPDTPRPAWPDAQRWTPAQPFPAPAQSVAPGGVAGFGPFSPAAIPAGRYIVLAEGDCPDDRANTRADTGLACAVLPTPLEDLVANDNNLGLRVAG